MFRHILVPLDGSALAESSLSAARQLARFDNAEITLMHVIEPHPPNEVHGQHHLTSAEEADRYLHGVAGRFFRPSDRVTYHVHAAPVSGVARGIAEHQSEFDHDLIVMCTHGRSGANTLVFGSIAQKIVSIGSVPVLIVHPRDAGSQKERFALSPILVPVDGTEAHEASLTIASELAEKTSSSIHLLMVVPTLSTLPGKWEDATKLLPYSADRMLEMAAEEAVEYLDGQRRRLSGRGIGVSAEMERGDPAKVICSSAGRTGANLLVLTTHGKVGMSALWEGSVASRVFSRIQLPVLLIPADRQSAER